MCNLLLLSSIDTPVPPSGKPNSVLSPMPNKEPSTVVPGSLDTRYYNALLRELPQECVSVPVMLHCIVEQVCFCKFSVQSVRKCNVRLPIGTVAWHCVYAIGSLALWCVHTPC